MKLFLILTVVALLALSPALTATVPGIGAVGSPDVALARDDGSGEEMDLWDWLVIYWTWNWDDWPM